jgi:hypothetical protein
MMLMIFPTLPPRFRDFHLWWRVGLTKQLLLRDQCRARHGGKQLGDPAKAAQALLKLVAAENPPMRLYLGTDASEIAAWEAVSRSTDFG